MKATKFLLCIFFIFSSVEGFSQIIQNTSICTRTGSSASITVDYPNPSTCEWQMKIAGIWTTITNSNAGTIYSGYSSSTLNITKALNSPATGTLYRVLVNNSNYSNEAELIVNPIPISKTISGASQVCAGGSKTLTYAINSVGTIQWQSSSTPNLGDFYDIDGETMESYSATDLQETTWFRVMNSSGECGSVYSPVVQVVVNPLPVAGNIEGGDINVCQEKNSTELTLYNSEGTIQWQKASEIAGLPSTFADITSANLDKYTTSSLLATTYFRAKVYSGVCAIEYTQPVAIIVDLTPSSTSISGASTICMGNSKELTYGIGSVGDILWQYSITSNSGDFYNLDGETERIYTATDLQETTWFRVMNSNGVCEPVYSKAVQVVVNPLPVAGNIDGGDITVCKTSNSTELTLYNSEGTIEWQKASESLAGGTPSTFYPIANATSATFLAAALTATTYFRAKLSSGVCAIEYTVPVVITVVPLPVTRSITGASTAFTGGSITLTYGAGSTGDIQWQSSTISSSEGFNDISGETELVYLATDLQKTTWFRVMNTNDICSSYSPAVQVLVNPLSVPVFVDVDSEFKVRAFPNPFETEFNINLNSISLDPIELKIYDMLGRLIENHRIESSEINSMSIGTTYPSGFFTVLIKQGQQERNVKVLKK